MNKQNSSFLSKTILSILLLLGLSSSLYALEKSAKDTLAALENKEQKEVSLPKIKSGRLKDSFKYYILTNHELPIVKAVVYIKGGTIYDPPGRNGLASFTASLSRSGGAAGLSAEALDKQLDMMASNISISAKEEYIEASISCGADSFEETLKLLLDIFFRPRLEQSRFDLIKRQFKNAIKRRPDAPEELASLGFDELLYGKNNRWGAYSTISSVESISIEDIKANQKRYYHPANMIIGVTGDVSAGSVKDILKSYSHYPQKNVAPILPPNSTPKPAKGVYIIDKESNQVIFNVGHQGSIRFNPDKYSITVMNEILGGGGSFNSILPDLIRVKKGLAYSVWSSYRFGPKEAPGTFKVYLATKSSSTKEALDLVIGELKGFASGKGITSELMNDQKESILRKLVFEYASSEAIISNVVRFNYFGYPDNYIEEYGKKIAEVSLDDVKRAAKKYIHPEDLQIVLVGKADVTGKMLKGNMEVHYLSLDK